MKPSGLQESLELMTRIPCQFQMKEQLLAVNSELSSVFGKFKPDYQIYNKASFLSNYNFDSEYKIFTKNHQKIY
jgi:hypothetical protein